MAQPCKIASVGVVRRKHLPFGLKRLAGAAVGDAALGADVGVGGDDDGGGGDGAVEPVVAQVAAVAAVESVVAFASVVVDAVAGVLRRQEKGW